MNPNIQQLVDLAKSQVGIREEGGNNRGEHIREYQSATWLAPGPWPWCAAFTAWLLREWTESPDVQAALSLRPEQLEKWRCKDASAYGWETWASKHGYRVLRE